MADITGIVRERYGEAANRARSGQAATCGCGTSACGDRDPITSNLYDSAQAAAVPPEAVLASLGCGNPTALADLKPGEVCVCHIHDTLRLPQPTASRHLAYLRRAGLVTARRDGTWMHYRMAPDLHPVITGIIQSAGHAMSHVSGMHRDRQRFEKHAGKRLAVVQPPQAMCCSR